MKKELPKNLSKKLLAYSSAAGAVMAVGQTANAQIVYTDVNPDETVVGSSYNLDLNDDGTTDFVLTQGSWYSGWSTVRITPQGGAGFLSTQYPPASGWGTYTFAQMLEANDAINDAGQFNASSGNSTMSLGFFGTIGAGPFLNQTEKFLGLRFTLDGGSTYHYGWARVSVDGAAASLVVHDYAYESAADTEILAGAGIVTVISAETASNLVAVDAGNDHNGLDFGYTFDAASDEGTVGEYRLMVVKEANAGSFDLAAANALTENFTAITPAGGPYTGALAADATDVDGDAIAEDVAYQFFVLSVADGTNATANALSAASNAVTLINDISVAENSLQNVKVFSNNGELNINLGSISNAVISVYNVNGQEVFATEQSDMMATYNISDLSSGIYVVHLFTGDDAISKNIVVK